MQGQHKIGEVAEALGVTVRTVRYYEEEGLLEPIRTKGGTRYYTERHLARLRAILQLVNGGFSLEMIRLISVARAGSRSGNEGSSRVTAQLEEVLEDVSARIEALSRLKEEIIRARSFVRKCRGCANEPTSEGCPDCPVKNHVMDVELLGLIWDQED